LLFDEDKNMKSRLLAIAILFATLCSQAQAQVKLSENTSVVFATVPEARKILTSRDPFVVRMSPFDRAARMKTDRKVSEKEYLEFVGKNVLAWNDAEKKMITSALQGIRTELEVLSLKLPSKVFMVKTTGNEEGRAAYTRANAIVLPKSVLTAPTAKIRHKICHELFHIMSRENPDLREKLYAAIGFVKCNEIAFPLELKPRKLTNPDAPMNDHYIRVQVAGKERWGIPILFSTAEKYDVKRGGEFFSYAKFQILLVERDEVSSTVMPIYDGQNPKLVDMQQVSGFFEQVGKNTQYIIHPEEILAENFALLVLGERNVPSPEVIKKLREILNEEQSRGSGP